MAMRWRSEKTGNVLNGVAPNGLVRLVIDDAAAAEEVIELYEIPDQFVRRMLAKAARRPGREAGSLRFDLKGPALSNAGLCSEIWEAAHLPPPEAPTRYVARVRKAKSPPLDVGGPVQFVWTHQQGADASAGGEIPGAPVKAKAGAHKGSSTELRGTAYCPTDPDIEIRVLSTDRRGDGGAQADLFMDYIYRYLDATGVRFDEANLVSVFQQEFESYLQDTGASFSLEPARASIAEGEEIEFALRVDFDIPARTLLALGAFDAGSNTLLAVSPVIALSFDGDLSTVEF